MAIVESAEESLVMQYSSKNSSDMKNLMRRAPNIEFSRPPSFRDAKLCESTKNYEPFRGVSLTAYIAAPTP